MLADWDAESKWALIVHLVVAILLLAAGVV